MSRQRFVLCEDAEAKKRGRFFMLGITNPHPNPNELEEKIVLRSGGNNVI